MKKGMHTYTRAQHLVNWSFLGFLALAPVVAVFAFPTFVDTRDVQTIVPSCWLLAVLLFADWYSWKHTNTVAGCLSCVGLGALMVIAAGALSSLAHRGGVAGLLDLSPPDWLGHRWLLRIVVLGSALAAVGVVSIPRTLLLRLAGGGSKSPTPESQ